MRQQTLAHEFVEYVPGRLAEGVLYVSIAYRTAVHLCACGCGNKVATPISPADWKLQYDGDTVSLTPSIGNWGFPCRSHYWIDRDRIRWAGAWTSNQIAAGRERDDHGRASYFDERKADSAKAEQTEKLPTTQLPWHRRLLRRITRF